MSSIVSSSPPKQRSLIPPWLSGGWGMAGISLIVYLLIFLNWTYFHWGGEAHISLIGNLAILPPMFLATLMAWRVAAQERLNPHLRRAWFILGLSIFMNFIGNAVWTYLENFLHVQPFPSVADYFYLGSYPLMLWGLLTLPGAPQDRRELLIFWFNLIIVFTTASMFVGYFLIIPTAAVNNSDLLSQLLATAYPVFSLILLGGLVALLLRRPESDSQATLFILLFGFSFFLASDLAFGYASLAGTYNVGSWIDVGWHIAQVFLVLAALRQLYRAPTVAGTFHWINALNSFVRRLPVIAVVMGYGLVFYVALVKFDQSAVWLLISALLLTAFVIGQQIISPAFANLSIRIKVILTFFLVSALSVSLVTLMSYLTIRSNLQSAVGITLKAHARDRAQAISSLLSKQSDALEGFVLSKVIQDQAAAASAEYTTDSLAVIRDQLDQHEMAWRSAPDSDPLVQDVLNNETVHELRKFQNNFTGYSDLLLTDKYGALLAATTRPTNYDQSILSWWQAAFHNGEGTIFMSQPILHPDTGSRYMIIVIPVRAHLDSALVGILMATYSLQDIEQMLVTKAPGQMVENSLALPTGQMLMSGNRLISIEQNTLERLQATSDLDFTVMSFEDKSKLVSQALVTVPSSDPEETIAFHGLNWTIIAHQEHAEAFAPLHAAWRTALLSTLIVLLLTTGLAVVLTQVLIAPISRLTVVAGQIAAGDLSAKAHIESQDEIGRLARTFNTMLDELSRTRKELEENEAHYRSLVDYSPDMIAVHSDNKYVFINPAGVKLLGAKNAEEIIGRSILDLVPKEDNGLIRTGIEWTQLSGEPTPIIEQRVERLDGTIVQTELRAIPTSYAGQPAIQIVMRDITDRKRAEEQIHQLLTEVEKQRGDLEIRVAERTEELNSLNQRLQVELTERQQLMLSLRESEERFRLLFDASPDAIFLIDPHNSDTFWPIIDCNQAAANMNGYTREELIGQSIDILNLKKGNPEEFASVLENLRREEVVRGMEASHLHKDGHAFPIEYSTTLLRMEDRELVLGIDRDITGRKQVEDAMNQAKDMAESASRAKSEFLSRMSHELRTPMNAILGFAQLLEMSRKEPLTSTQKERMKQIVKGGQHLLDLINEILDISRIEANRLHISLEPVLVWDSIQEALDLTVPLAVKRHIQIVTKLDNMDASPFVMADRQRFKQVMLNLLGNAVKYNYDAGSVIVTCQQTRSNHWRISITDTGPGISQANQARLFVPFERLGMDQPNVEGTGLGLVLAKRLVELMHGQIGVESMLGKGSTFWIELPSAESPVEQLQQMGGTGELPAMPSTARRILYVEDNVANFELIQQVLGDYSQIELLWATELKTGIEVARQQLPNLVLLDLHIGGRDGAEFLRHLKQDPGTSGIPVVVVSADATPGQIERLISLGAYAYLTKPLDVKHFIRLLEEIFGEKRI